MTKPLTARIEVFRPGTFKPMAGDAITYSAADLKAVADSYDPATAPAPVVIGHPATDAPAYGWIESFDYDSQEERLFATIGEIEPEFAELVKAGRFKKVSMAFFSPDQTHNPVAGSWYPPDRQGRKDHLEKGCSDRDQGLTGPCRRRPITAAGFP